MDVTGSRKEFRAGLKSKEEHTLLMRELNQRLSELKCQLAKFKEEYIGRLIANGELSKELIEYYLHNK